MHFAPCTLTRGTSPSPRDPRTSSSGGTPGRLQAARTRHRTRQRIAAHRDAGGRAPVILGLGTSTSHLCLSVGAAGSTARSEAESEARVPSPQAPHCRGTRKDLLAPLQRRGHRFYNRVQESAPRLTLAIQSLILGANIFFFLLCFKYVNFGSRLELQSM